MFALPPHPIISQIKTNRAIGSRNRGVLPSSLHSVCIYVCISRSPAPEVTFCSRRRLVVCIVVHVADGASPYQGFRYTPARMRARCSGHRYQTESSALAVKSLSVDSPSIESCVMKFVRVSVCVLPACEREGKQARINSHSSETELFRGNQIFT